MLDLETEEYYERHAEAFAARTRGLDMQPLQQRFLHYIPAGGRILDAGCGSGRDARCFQEAGFRVCAIDASGAMCRQARLQSGTFACRRTFDEVCGPDLYDGIWASASLLHVPRQALPAVLRRFHWALKEGGILYLSLKKGSGEQRRQGRLFADYTLKEAADMLSEGGLFSVLEAFETQDVRAAEQQRPWVNLIARAGSG